MRWRKRRELRDGCWFVLGRMDSVKKFHFGAYGVVVEDRHGSASLYVTDGGYGEVYCTVPLLSSRELRGKAIHLCAGGDMVLGMQVNGSPAVMVDTRRQRVMSRLGAAFGSSAWGKDVYRVWDRGLEYELFFK